MIDPQYLLTVAKILSNEPKGSEAEFRAAVQRWIPPVYHKTTKELVQPVDVHFQIVRGLMFTLDGSAIKGDSIVVLQTPSGNFFKIGNDCPDHEVANPLDASERGWCLYEQDALYFDTPGTLVEYDVFAVPTGRKGRDLYRQDAEGRWVRSEEDRDVQNG